MSEGVEDLEGGVSCEIKKQQAFARDFWEGGYFSGLHKF